MPAGGAAYLASLIAQRRAANAHTALVAAGDLVGASPLVSSLFADEPTIETLQASGALYRAWARANPGLYRLMFVGPSGSDYAPRAAMVEPIRRMLHRLQVAGVLAPHDADTMALSLWATTHGFVMLEMDVWPEGSIDTDAELSTVSATHLKPTHRPE